MAIQNTVDIPLENMSVSSSAPVSGAIPLALVTPGVDVQVLSIKGETIPNVFLANLGFVEGAIVSVVTELDGNVIVSIKDTRVALNKAMATRILTGDYN